MTLMVMNSRFNCQQSFYNEYQNNVHPNHQQRQQNSNQQNNNVSKTNGVVSNLSDSFTNSVAMNLRIFATKMNVVTIYIV